GLGLRCLPTRHPFLWSFSADPVWDILARISILCRFGGGDCGSAHRPDSPRAWRRAQSAANGGGSGGAVLSGGRCFDAVRVFRLSLVGTNGVLCCPIA